MRGRVARFAEATTLLRAPGECSIVERGVIRSLIIRCPDVCGELITVNLDPRAGAAWRLYERRGKLTVYPSVWRESGCKAHFIVWQDRLIWCDAEDRVEWNDADLQVAVRARLPRPHEPHRHYEEIAAGLDAIPWEVLWVCQNLVHQGRAKSSDRGRKFGAAI
jgi:hypothetical protein